MGEWMAWIADFEHQGDLRLVSLLLLVLMLVAREGGSLLHHQLYRPTPDAGEGHGEEGHILAAVLGLLALLVAFTFGLALERHEDQRQLVMDEANALTTAYFRTSLLDDPEPVRIAMRNYGQARLDFGRFDGEQRAAAEVRSKVLQRVVWQEARTALDGYQTTPVALLMLQPLNEAIDTADARHASINARLPAVVLTALGLYAIVSAGVMGYTLGVGGRPPHRLMTSVTFALVVLSIYLILDLDRSRSGAIRVPQFAMIEAVAGMQVGGHAPETAGP